MFAPPSPLVIVSCRWYLPARPITDPALHTRRGANDLKEEEEKEEEKEEREEKADFQSDTLSLSLATVTNALF